MVIHIIYHYSKYYYSKYYYSKYYYSKYSSKADIVTMFDILFVEQLYESLRLSTRRKEMFESLGEMYPCYHTVLSRQVSKSHYTIILSINVTKCMYFPHS